jgi:hypothetical protein
MANNDPFTGSRGGGGFPKVEELQGLLVLIRPTALERVADRFNEGQMKDRITADVVVFEEDGTQSTYEDMYFSQAGIVPTCKKVLKANNPNAPFALGRIGRGPTKDSVAKGIDTPEKLEKAIQEWVARGGKGKQPNYWWGLLPLAEEDAALARPVAMALLADNDPFAGNDES